MPRSCVKFKRSSTSKPGRRSEPARAARVEVAAKLARVFCDYAEPVGVIARLDRNPAGPSPTKPHHSPVLASCRPCYRSRLPSMRTGPEMAPRLETVKDQSGRASFEPWRASAFGSELPSQPASMSQFDPLRTPPVHRSIHRLTKVKCWSPPLGDRYSITSSAVANRVSGIVRPSALAVLRLMANPYCVGACTGRSPGFEPLRTRSTVGDGGPLGRRSAIGARPRSCRPTASAHCSADARNFPKLVRCRR